MQLAVVTILFYGFFVAVAAGMTVIQDEQWRLGELLHATPLRPGEYIWGKFAAVLAGCAVDPGDSPGGDGFLQSCPARIPKPRRFAGRSTLLNYLQARAALLGADDRLPGGRLVRGRRVDAPADPGLPAAGGRSCSSTIFFLWDWSPSWLDPRLNDLLMWIDPAGFRWLNETWLKVDRGVQFYNNEAIPPDRGFLISRRRLRRPGLGAAAA